MCTCMGELTGKHLGVDLDWKQSSPGVRHMVLPSQLSRPSDKAETQTDIIRLWPKWRGMRTKPHMSYLTESFTMMRFVIGLIRMRVTAISNNGRALRAFWSLPQFSIDLIDPICLLSPAKIQTLRLNDSLTCLCLSSKGRFIIYLTQGE